VNIETRSAEEIRASRRALDLARVQEATESDIARWQREDDFDERSLGPPRLVSGGPDIRAIRGRLGLSQESFALRFGLAPRTVQEWEQGRRVPEGPARTLLLVIAREPAAVERALLPRDDAAEVAPAHAVRETHATYLIGPHAGDEVMAKILARLAEYGREIEASDLRPASKATRLGQATMFVRWLAGDYRPGEGRRVSRSGRTADEA
jgi:putative transcriptional regulator